MRGFKRHAKVRSDLRSAARWYEEQAALGAAFLRAVEEAVQAILAAPRAWPAWGGAPRDLELRYFPLARFPYLVAYVVAADDEPIVLAIAHAKHRPGYWLRRVRSSR